jgi:hypothetical protein
MPSSRFNFLITTLAKKMPHKLGSGVCVMLILSASCSSRTLELPKNLNKGADPNSSTAPKTEASYDLDLRQPSISQPIEPGDLVQEGATKFVQIEVTRVVNPKRYPLSFQVHYQPGSQEKIYLGSFSLYPADNPGKFIVATQGKVKNEGAIVLSLVVPDQIDASDTIKVTVKKIKFLRKN